EIRMADIVGVVGRVALPDNLMADLEKRLMHLHDALAGLEVGIQRPGAEFSQETRIGDKPLRFFVRESSTFGNPAKGVVHRPVQVRKEVKIFLAGALTLSGQRVLSGPDGEIHQEVTLD